MEINLPSADDPTALKQDLEWMVKEELMHALETQLSGMNLQHLNLIIPKIQVDLHLQTHNWHRQFVPLCVEKVQQQIEQHLSAVLPVIHPFHTPSESLVPSDGKSLFVSAMYQATLFERLMHFLAKGVLPPGQGYYNLETFTDKLQGVLKEITVPAFLQQLNPLLDRNEAARYRFLHALPVNFSWRILQAALQKLGIGVPDSGTIGISLSTGTDAIVIHKLLALGLELTRHENITPARQQVLEKSVALIAGITQHQPAAIHAAEALLAGAAAEIPSPLTQENGTTKPTENEYPADPATIEPEGIFCANAGIVLMAAFLPALFESLHLLNTDGLFIDEPAQHKAIHVLYWMATGDDVFDESQSIVPKVLCGLDPQSRMDVNMLLSAHDISEVTDLLHHAMEYWQHNGKAIFHSIDGLRDHFLQRNGKLDVTSGMHLTIEKAAIDILLSSLPWTYSMVKHRWMTAMLHSEW